MDIKGILSKKPFELCDKCKKCEFNKNPNNKHKPCYYEYCDKREERKDKMKEAVCKQCGAICEWLEEDSAYCHECKKEFKVDELIVNEIIIERNWCEYFNCSCREAKQIDSLGECNYECESCKSRKIWSADLNIIKGELI